MPDRILVADDSLSIRCVVRATLEGAGFQVIEAADGEQARNRMSRRVSLVVTDLNMPKLDGIGLARALRQEDDYRDTPILMLTTESQQAAKPCCREVGISDWIVKPFKPDQLLEAVRRALPERTS